MPGSLPRGVIGGGDPWEGCGDTSTLASPATSGSSEARPGLPSTLYPPSGPSEGQRGPQQRAPRRSTLHGAPGCVCSPHRHLAPRDERCQVPSLGHTLFCRCLLRVAEPKNDMREVRRSSLHPREDPHNELSPPLCLALPGFWPQCEASAQYLGKKQTGELLSCPPPPDPPTRPSSIKLSAPTQSPRALWSCFRPSVQHQPHGLGPNIPPTRLPHAPVPGPCTQSHLGSAVPDNCQQLAGPKAQLRSLSSGRGSGCSSSQGGHGSCNSFRPRDGPGTPRLGHGRR